VGENLKKPRYLIWIISIESHFSVLFSITQSIPSHDEKPFDLYYYDQFGNQNEEYRITVDPSGRMNVANRDEDDLIPPLEDCIQTRWPGATFDWNGSEPLL
jgi:hypothetical protein